MENYDLSTISRDGLLLLLRAAKDEIVKYTRCREEVERCKEHIEEEKKNSKIKGGCFGAAIFGIIICAFMIIFMVHELFFSQNVQDVRNGGIGIGDLIGPTILCVISIAIIASQMARKRTAQNNIRKGEAQLPSLQEKEKKAWNEINYAWIVPEEFRNELATTTMLRLVSNQEADTWKGVAKEFRTYLNRLEEKSHREEMSIQAQLQTDYARQTLSAARWVAITSTATAIGVWRR